MTDRPEVNRRRDPLPSARVKLTDVARRAGVHVSSASRALNPEKAHLVNPETAARVLAAARELGYTPDLVAQGLKHGSSRTIGVIVPDLANPFFAPVIHGITSVLEGAGYMALVADTLEDHLRLERAMEHLVRRRADAIIIAAARLGDAGIVRRLAASGNRIVLAVRDLPGSGLPSVTHDDVRGAELAAQHLASLGHRSVAQLKGPNDVDTFLRRTTGFESAARDLSLEELSIQETANAPSLEEGHRLMRIVLESLEPRPTAVFAHNDLMAIGALDALREAGLRCPMHISVMGFNDSPLVDHISPALSTIRQPAEQLGRFAAEIALTLIRDQSTTPASLSLAPTLVARQSTGRPYRLRKSPANV